MEGKAIEKLYHLKEQGVEHLKAGHFLHSSVYFKDVLDKFDAAIETIDNEDDMEKAIRELKLSSHKNLSLCFLKLGKYQLSAKESEIVLQIQPNNLKMLYRVGWALIQLKRYEEAQKHLKRGFQLDPQEKEIMKALEELEYQQNQIRQAQKPKEKGFIIKLIIFMLEIIFWFPLWVYRKGKGMLVMLEGEEGKKER